MDDAEQKLERLPELNQFQLAISTKFANELNNKLEIKFAQQTDRQRRVNKIEIRKVKGNKLRQGRTVQLRSVS